jgi:DNA polymerase-3 subunit beta
MVSSSSLLKHLTPLAGVIVSNPVVPALQNFLFSVSPGLLIITASDLEVSLQTSLPVESGATEWGLCVPARLLVDTLKALPDQPVTFTATLDEDRIELRTANGTYKLSGDRASDFPKVPVLSSIEPLELPGAVVRRAVDNTSFAISTDELRPAMCGVLIQLEATRLTFVATDGHRLLRYRRTDLGAGNPPRNLIVPRKAWHLLGKLVTTDALVLARFGQQQAVFSINDLTLTTRLVDERYPDYENVIPLSNPNKLVIDRRELLHSVRRLGNFTNRTTHQVRLELNAAAVRLFAEDLDFNREADEQLSCQYDGEEMKIGFNARFLNEVLTQLQGAEVQVEMSTPNRAALLMPTSPDAGEEVLMLVMPVMLNR